MNVLRRFALLCAIIATFSIGGISSASAGNCTDVRSSAPFSYNAQPSFNGIVGVCNGVNQVQYGLGYNGGSTGKMLGNGPVTWLLSDFTWGGSPIDPLSNNGITYVPTGGDSWVTYAVTRYNCLSSTQAITAFYYRIQSIDIHGVTSWGPWHVMTGAAWTSFVYPACNHNGN